MRRRPISLLPYAGQTIRVRLLNNSSHASYAESLVDRIRVDYDTVPVVVLSAQEKTTTDSATLFVAQQLRGFNTSLSYNWRHLHHQRRRRQRLGDLRRRHHGTERHRQRNGHQQLLQLHHSPRHTDYRLSARRHPAVGGDLHRRHCLLVQTRGQQLGSLYILWLRPQMHYIGTCQRLSAALDYV